MTWPTVDGPCCTVCGVLLDPDGTCFAVHRHPVAVNGKAAELFDLSVGGRWRIRLTLERKPP